MNADSQDENGSLCGTKNLSLNDKTGSSRRERIFILGNTGLCLQTRLSRVREWVLEWWKRVLGRERVSRSVRPAEGVAAGSRHNLDPIFRDEQPASVVPCHQERHQFVAVAGPRGSTATFVRPAWDEGHLPHGHHHCVLLRRLLKARIQNYFYYKLIRSRVIRIRKMAEPFSTNVWYVWSLLVYTAFAFFCGFWLGFFVVYVIRCTRIR